VLYQQHKLVVVGFLFFLLFLTMYVSNLGCQEEAIQNYEVYEGKLHVKQTKWC